MSINFTFETFESRNNNSSDLSSNWADFDDAEEVIAGEMQSNFLKGIVEKKKNRFSLFSSHTSSSRSERQQEEDLNSFLRELQTKKRELRTKKEIFKLRLSKEGKMTEKEIEDATKNKFKSEGSNKSVWDRVSRFVSQQ
jgi:hypothetical protein